MATDTLTGRNISFPIYNADGSAFHDLVLRKAVVDSVVMSLGDKITGDVYYRDNSLEFTMQEHVTYGSVNYYLVNPPTVVREGMASDNGELRGMTKYSFEFYHPMYMLGNFPFTDVATKQGEEKYLSQNKTFSWIGKPQDFFDKLNKNLQWTEWYVRKSDRFPKEKDDELSDVLSFDNVMVSEAIKTAYETWGIPYVISQIHTTDALYAQGKRFVVEFGLPSNEVYESESSRQLDKPFVFKFGQGVGLKNNSRTPRNNKIITRIAGYGSEDNIPFGYPQIVWDGDERWDYTAYEGDVINYDENGKVINTPKETAYPIYKGIVGGQYVKLIKHPFTRNHLMPSIYSETVNKKVNPYAVGYDHTIEIKDFYDAVASKEYPYSNEINLKAPSYEAHEFSDIKPELDSERTLGIVNAVPLNSDLTSADHWDDTMDDDGNYLQSYFRITLPQLSFDLYACAAITQEMEINMRSGACIGCTFAVQVDWDDYKRNFYDDDGNFVPNGAQRDLSKYPKSNDGSINVIVQKDNSTFGTLMPNVYQQPKSGDTFVFIGISLPLSYITSAEKRLDEAMMSYMLENNVYYFDYPLKFDEHFLATHTNILEQIHPNTVIRFEYNNEELQLFVKQLTIKYENKPLPTYDITLTDDIEVVLNKIGQVADDVEKLSSLISLLRQNYSRNVWNEIAKKLSKVNDDTAQGFIRFIQGLQVGNMFTSGVLGEGGVFRMDADGKVYIEADKLYVRMKAYFDSVEIKDYKHTSGNRIVSKAGMRCTHVEWYSAANERLEQNDENLSSIAYFRCYYRRTDGTDTIGNDFVASAAGQQDLAFCDKTSVEDGLNHRRYWRAVVGKNGSLTDEDEFGWIDLSASDCESGSDIPMAEDDIIQLGNRTDDERQGAIVEYVGGEDAPSYQIYQGIDSYSLNGKNYVSLGYSSQTGRAYLNVYGDTYIGDKPDAQGNAASYIRYNSQKKQLEIKARVEFTNSDAELDDLVQQHQRNDAYDDADIRQIIQDNYDSLQGQIDGAIDTWFYNGEPSANVLPESEWKDADQAAGNNNERLKHLGDVYYDNKTGYAYRYTNNGTAQYPVFVWTAITDSAVVDALAKAASAQQAASDAQNTADNAQSAADDAQNAADNAQATANSKRTIYLVWNAWMSGTTNNLKAGDLFIPNDDTAIGGNTYKAGKVYKCTTDGTASFEEISYTDDTTVNTIIEQYGNILGVTPTAQNVGEALGYLREVLGGKTSVDGGLILSHMIALKDGNDIMAGINGTLNSNLANPQRTPAAWYGGRMVDREALSATDYAKAWDETRYAKSLFRFDGSGYLASGNISWTQVGQVTIKDLYTLIGNDKGFQTDVLNKATLFSNLFHTSTEGTEVGTNTMIRPQATFEYLTIKGNDVATEEWVDDNFVSIKFFNAIFQLENANGSVITPNADTKAKDRLKILVGAYTDQYLSALGLNPNSSGGGSGGATALDDLVDVELSSPSATQILIYNGTKWVNAAAPVTYELPVATANILGGIRLGYSATGKNYAVQLDGNGRAYVNVPWTDTTYALPTASSTQKGGVKVGSTLAISGEVLNLASGIVTTGTYRSVTVDTYGRVTGGTNPTTLSGYGITDAKIADGVVTLGSSTITPLTAASSLAWGKITGVPTTLAGYGITDAKIANGVITLGANTITPLTSHQTLHTLSIYGGATKVLDFKPDANASIYIKAGGDISLTNDTANKYITLSYTHPTNGANTTISAADGRVLSAITVNSLGHVTSVSYKALAAADIPALAISKITNLQTSLDAKLPLAGGTMTGQLRSSVATGTAPFVVASTTAVANLNADLLDGQHGSYYATASGLTAANNNISTLQGYFGSGVANSAAKLTTVSKTAWGQTYWTSGGVPTSISGNMSGVGNISLNGGSAIHAADLNIHGDGSEMYIGNRDNSSFVNIVEDMRGWDDEGDDDTWRLDVSGALSGITSITTTGDDAYIQIGSVRLMYDATNNALKVVGSDGSSAANFYATGGVSSLGMGSGGSGGGGVDMTTVWSALAANTSEQINVSHLSSALGGVLSDYASQQWVRQQGFLTSYTEKYTGTVTQVKVGATAYNPSSGVVSLPAYPTTLPASDVYAWAKAATKPGYTWSEIGSRPTALSSFTNDSGYITSSALSSYLPLSGGTLTGDLVFAATTFGSNPTDSRGLYWSGSTDTARIFYRLTAYNEGSLVLYLADDGSEYINFLHSGGGSVHLRPNTREFYPSVTNTGSVGTSSLKWANVYATTFHGALDGTASHVVTTNHTTNNIEYAVVWHNGDIDLYKSPSNFMYNPGANLLKAGRFQSTVATGTAPFTVASQTVVTNLNADLLDGVHLAGLGGIKGVLRSWSRGAFTSANQYFGNGNVVTIDPIGSGCLSANDTIISLGDANFRNTQLLVRYDVDGVWYRRIGNSMVYGPWSKLAFTTDITKSAVGLGNVANYDQSKAIKGITRSGTTFTYTCLDGTTGTFTQQDTTYSAGTGIALSGTTFSNSGVRGVSISGNYLRVNTNGTNADLTIPYATTASSANFLSANTVMQYGLNGVNYFNFYGTAGAAAGVNDTPTTAWWHIMRFNHPNSAGHYTDLAVPSNDDHLYYKIIRHGVMAHGGWVKVIDSLNIGSYNAGSATKLQTARTIWGQTFDGTNNVSGMITGATGLEFTQLYSTSGHGGYIDFHFNGSTADYTSRIIEGSNGLLSINEVIQARLNGNVGIGTKDPAYKLHVAGTLGVTGSLTVNGQLTCNNALYMTSHEIFDVRRINRLISFKSDHYLLKYFSSATSGNKANAIDISKTKLSLRYANNENGMVLFGAADGSHLKLFSHVGEILRVGAYNHSEGTKRVCVLSDGLGGGRIIDFTSSKSSDPGHTTYYGGYYGGYLTFGPMAELKASKILLNCGGTNVRLSNGIVTVSGTLRVGYHTTVSYSAVKTQKTLQVVGNGIQVWNGSGMSSDDMGTKTLEITTRGLWTTGYVTALSQNTSSDERLKDITGIVDGLSVEQVANAPAIRYLWKRDHTMGMQVGTVAQYWQHVLPEVVKTDGDGYYTLQYGVAALLAAIATARKVVDHERRIKELEEENKKLKSAIRTLQTAA